MGDIALDDISVTGDPILSAVTVAAVDATGSEQGADTVTFRISRTGTNGDLDVNYLVSGTALSDDYSETLSGTATILDGQSFVDITLTPTDDSYLEGTESLRLSVVGDAAYTLGVTTSATASSPTFPSTARSRCWLPTWVGPRSAGPTAAARSRSRPTAASPSPTRGPTIPPTSPPAGAAARSAA